MDSSSHDPGGDNAKVLKCAATVPETATVPEKFESVPAKFASVPEKFGPVPEKFGLVPERVASAPAVLSHIEKGAGQGKSQQQQKPALKKPDKLAPCPRCESLDTKFCYYNNYNVNQPRHFCKNCQRYWTAGGTLRNVPVGAGRRKNKHGSLQARHGSPSEQQVRLEPSLRPQCQFSPPLAASSSYPSSHGRGVSSGAATHGSSLQTAEAARPQSIPAEPQASISSDQGGSRLHDASGDPEAEKEECAEPCTSSAPSHSSSEMDTTAQEVQSTIRVPAASTTITTTTTTTPQPGAAGVVPGLGSIWTAAPTPFGLFNGSWPFGYNVGWSSPPPGAGQPAVGGITTWSPPPNALWPGVCWGSTLIPGIPPGLVTSPWMSPGWGVPWVGADAAAAAATVPAAAKAPTAGISSRLPIRPVLSKHPRDRFELEPHWIPKKAKLDDRGRSSVWTAVGAEHQLDSPGSNFKAFLPVRKAPASVTTSDANTTRVES